MGSADPLLPRPGLEPQQERGLSEPEVMGSVALHHLPDGRRVVGASRYGGQQSPERGSTGKHRRAKPDGGAPAPSESPISLRSGGGHPAETTSILLFTPVTTLNVTASCRTSHLALSCPPTGPEAQAPEAKASSLIYGSQGFFLRGIAFSPAAALPAGSAGMRGSIWRAMRRPWIWRQLSDGFASVRHLAVSSISSSQFLQSYRNAAVLRTRSLAS